MDSDLLAKWTATITNIAVVIGLVFVGLEFRNTTKAIEADRVDSITQAIIASNTLLLQTEGLSELLFEAYARPEELTPVGLDKLHSYWYVTYSQFAQVHQVAIDARDYCKSADNLCTGRYEIPFSEIDAR